MMADQMTRDDLQYEALGTDTSTNPRLPLGGPLPFRLGLQTQRKIVTLAINELLSTINTIRNTVFTNLGSLYNNVIGSYLDDITLLPLLYEVDENLIKGLNKTYRMIVGNPENPVTIEEIGGSINQSILNLQNDLKEQTSWTTKDW